MGPLSKVNVDQLIIKNDTHCRRNSAYSSKVLPVLALLTLVLLVALSIYVNLGLLSQGINVNHVDAMPNATDTFQVLNALSHDVCNATDAYLSSND
ncbi:hypothetical protein [Caldivirga sp.]|uniref:hypothetical protein n=1 Tax=Caldivirga sp. TaxID=2080243 RepID=UPI0025C396FD|nr:hypothetical protein [Caldivirga sp.]